MESCQDWFHRAGLGLFVHWGIASVAGVDLSWGGVKDRPWCPSNADYVPDYYSLAKKFRPRRYDPDRWLAAARAAGMEYAVLTAKHHDGYALWPTECGEFGVRQFMDGRDLVADFLCACRRQGMKAGLYFSLPDWSHPDMVKPLQYKVWDDFNRRPLTEPNDLLRFERYYAHVRGQITELVTRYGTLDLLWLDGLLWNPSLDTRMAEIYALVRHHQPEILMGRGPYGAYRSLEDRLPERPPEGPWELCTSWHACGGWGYYREEKFHDLDWVFERWARVRGWGGNLLLNIGPRPDGDLPRNAYRGLAAMAEWSKGNGPAVKDVERGPWPPRCSMPITRRRGVWYVHVLRSHRGPVVVTQVPRPVEVRLLRTGQRLKFALRRGDLRIELPPAARRTPDEVIALSWSPDAEYLASL